MKIKCEGIDTVILALIIMGVGLVGMVIVSSIIVIVWHLVVNVWMGVPFHSGP